MEWIGTLFGELLKIGGPIYVVIGLFILVLLIGIRLLWKELTAERKKNDEKYERIISDQIERNEKIVKEMFEVVNRNTLAATKHAEINAELKESMRELRTVISVRNSSP